MKGWQIAMVCGALCFGFGARAQLVSMSWTGAGAASGLSLSGDLNTSFDGSSGNYTATSAAGYITITETAATPYAALAGQYTLVANPTVLAMATFNTQYNGTSQGYLYDDQLTLNSGNAVDVGGLLFQRSDGAVVNVYSLNGTTFLTDSCDTPLNRIESLAGNLAINTVSDPMTVTAVPEPATITAAALMLLPLALGTLRLLTTRIIRRLVPL